MSGVRSILLVLASALAACGESPATNGDAIAGDAAPRSGGSPGRYGDAAAVIGDDGDAGAALDAGAASDGDAPRGLHGPARSTIGDAIGLSAGPPTCAGSNCDAQRAAFFAAIAPLGVRAIRMDLTWNDVEPSRGQWSWGGLDAAVAAATSAHVDVLGILDYSAAWANAQHDTGYPPGDDADFVAYATAIATRYDGTIRRYEVWNEPNAGFRFWKSSFGGDPTAFGALTAKTARAIAALGLASPPSVAPGGTVFLSQLVPLPPFGTIPSGPDFARDAFAANADLAPSIGAFAFHAYDSYPPRDAPESSAIGEVPLADKIRETGNALTLAGYTFDRPLWLTEIGWPTANGVSEAAQARWLVRSIAIALLGGVERTYLYTLDDGRDPPAWTFTPEGSFGLRHADGSPKASFAAIRALVATLGAWRVVDRVVDPSLPGDAWILHLTRDADGAGAWIAWRADDAQGPFAWTVPSGATRAIATGGDAAPIANGQVEVGPDPVYLVP